jgi:protoheme IX farnesyltransferase
MESAAETATRVPDPAVAGAAGAARPVGVRSLPRGTRRREAALSLLRDYLALTKPRIISLLLLTTVTAMFVADPLGPPLAAVLWTMLGGYLAAGGAGAINHYLDREADARMARTRGRPLASGRIAPAHGLAFGVTLGGLAIVQLALTVNPLAAALSLAGLLGYVLVYTAWLKPLTPQNIVIGGAAGAVPPLVGWAAATGSLDLDALWLFAVVFLWTPPHFWALALLIKDDYARTGVPMLPVVRGDASTRRQILVYSLLLVAATLTPAATGPFGLPYLITAGLLGAGFVALAARLDVRPSREGALRLYLASLAYLALLFCAMALDRVIGA